MVFKRLKSDFIHCLSVTNTATLWQDFSKTFSKSLFRSCSAYDYFINNSKQIRICSFAQVYFIYLLISVSVISSSMCQILQPGTLKTTLFPGILIQILWKVNQSESELVSSSSSGHCCVLCTGCRRSVGVLSETSFTPSENDKIRTSPKQGRPLHLQSLFEEVQCYRGADTLPPASVVLLEVNLL